MAEVFTLEPLPPAFPSGTDIVPFSVQYGAGIAGQFAQLRKWLDATLVPWINKNLSDWLAADKAEHDRLIAEWNANVDEINARIERAEASIGEAVTEAEAAKVAAEAARDLAQMYASQAQSIQDQAIATITGDDDSVTRGVLDGLYATVSQFGNVTNALSELEEDVKDNRDFAATELATAVSSLSASIGTKLDAAEADKFAVKASLPIFAAEYGVSADKADNTIALQNVLNNARLTKRAVKLPAGDIKTKALTCDGPISISGEGAGVTRLVALEAGPIIKVSGSIAQAVGTLSANAARGDSTINVASTANIFADDILVLHDNASYVSTDETYKSGEQVRVKQVLSATQFTIHGVVRGSWGDAGRAYLVSNSAVLSKVTFIDGVSIRDLSVLSPNNQATAAIRLEYVRNPLIENVEIPRGGHYGIFLMTCRDSNIGNVTIHDLTDDLGNGFVGYAIAVSQACENTTVIGGHIYRVRHGFTTIGGNYGMPHGVVVMGLTLSECTLNALDTHAAGDGILFTGNVIESGVGGISIRSRDTMVVGNIIRNVTSHGITISEGVAGTIDIKDNSICRVVGAVHGIAIRDKADNVRITGNTLEDIGADGIWISADSNTIYVAQNYIKNIGRGPGMTNRNGIVAHTTGNVQPITGGWQILDNMFVQAIGSAARAVYGTGGVGMTMMSVYGNKATGTFGITQFEFASGKGANNIVV